MFLETDHSMLASDLRCLNRFLAAKQEDAGAVFSKNGLDIALLEKPHARYPLREVEVMLNALAERYNDPLLGLTLAHYFRITDTHGLGVAVLSSANALEALKTLVDNQALISTVAPFEVTESNDAITLTCRLSDMVLARSISEEYLLKVLIDVMRLSSPTGFKVERVGFTRRRPDNIGHHLKSLGCPVKFEQPVAHLTLTRQHAEASYTTSNVDLLDSMSPLLDRLLRSVPGEHYLSAVRRALLMRRDVSSEIRGPIAAALSMSTAHLDQSLRDSKLDSGDLLDELRAQLATLLLPIPGLSEQDVAENCGFADAKTMQSILRFHGGGTDAPSPYRGTLRDQKDLRDSD